MLSGANREIFWLVLVVDIVNARKLLAAVDRVVIEAKNIASG